MKVVHLSASDVGGGAARSAYRLHLGLVEAGVDSEMLVLNRVSRDCRAREYQAARDVPSRIQRKLWRLTQGRFATSHRPLGSRSLEIFSTDRSVFGEKVLAAIGRADIVNLHWVAGMFEFTELAGLAERQPVVWTLHDMNPFTGGCHFDEGCGRFRSHCGKCPQLASASERDLSSRILDRKLSTTGRIEPSRLNVVAPSRWLSEEARGSAVLGRFEVQTVPYGLETDVFQPRDRTVIRNLLDIPLDARVILFLAEGLGNRRKGFDLLLTALEQLPLQENTFLIAVGGGSVEVTERLRLPVRWLPPISNDRYLSFIYSAADVFVMASRADNLPNTVLESLSCGTPVAGFAVGGVPDLVDDGETGRLATPGDPASLAAVLTEMLSHPEELEAMRGRCRECILESHTLLHQAQGYLPIYERLAGLTPPLGTASKLSDSP